MSTARAENTVACKLCAAHTVASTVYRVLVKMLIGSVQYTLYTLVRNISVAPLHTASQILHDLSDRPVLCHVLTDSHLLVSDVALA